MKLLVILDVYDAAHYTFTYNEIDALQRAGLSVRVICDRVGQLNDGHVPYNIIKLPEKRIWNRLIHGLNIRNMDSLIQWLPYYKERREIIKHFEPDVVHCHFGTTAVQFFTNIKSALKNCPFVVTFHGYDASQMLREPKYVLKLTSLLKFQKSHFVYVSEHLKKNLLQTQLFLNSKNSSLLYYGIDVSKFIPQHKTKNSQTKKLLQISYFNEKKGHIYTLEAFKLFLQKNPDVSVKLILGGDGPTFDAIKKLAEKLNLCDFVEFSGWISRAKAIELMNEADYFVHHSVTSENGDQEGLPNGIIEAMAMELPILSTYHSGIPEIVEDGVNGYLVHEKDVERYAQRMKDILSWTYMPLNRQKVLEKFSLDVHTDNLIKIYKKCLGFTN